MDLKDWERWIGFIASISIFCLFLGKHSNTETIIGGVITIIFLTVVLPKKLNPWNYLGEKIADSIVVSLELKEKE